MASHPAAPRILHQAAGGFRFGFHFFSQQALQLAGTLSAVFEAAIGSRCGFTAEPGLGRELPGHLARQGAEGSESLLLHRAQDQPVDDQKQRR